MRIDQSKWFRMEEMTEMDTKTCRKCDEIVLLPNFSVDKSNPDGRSRYCKMCSAEMQRKHYKNNQEKTIENRKKWAMENPKKRSGIQKNYSERATYLAWKDGYHTRMRKFGFEPVTEEFTKAQVIATYGDKCYHCPAGEFEELDHYPIPVRDGGPHTLENVRPSCTSCNRSANGKRIKWQRK